MDEMGAGTDLDDPQQGRERQYGDGESPITATEAVLQSP